MCLEKQKGERTHEAWPPSQQAPQGKKCMVFWVAVLVLTNMLWVTACPNLVFWLRLKKMVSGVYSEMGIWVEICSLEHVTPLWNTIIPLSADLCTSTTIWNCAQQDPDHLFCLLHLPFTFSSKLHKLGSPSYALPFPASIVWKKISILLLLKLSHFFHVLIPSTASLRKPSWISPVDPICQSFGSL